MERNRAIPTAAPASTVAAATAWGTTVAIACLASVAWTISHDRSIRSELVVEGASEAMHTTVPPVLKATPSATVHRTVMTLDTGVDASSTPVVNAHHEYASPIEPAARAVPRLVEPARAGALRPAGRSDASHDVRARPADGL